MPFFKQIKSNLALISILSACNCNQKGSTTCEKSDGKCVCKPGYSNDTCNDCATGHYISSIIDGEVVCSGK